MTKHAKIEKYTWTVLVFIVLLASCAKPAPDPRKLTIKSSIKKYLGTPYQWGGDSFKGLDCSGFVRKVYQQVDIRLPHNAAQQYKMGEKVKKNNLKYGDVVFFNTKPLYKLSGCCFPCLLCSSSIPLVYKVGHNGIYTGNGKFAHSSSRAGVRLDRLDSAYWGPRYIGARRYLD